MTFDVSHAELPDGSVVVVEPRTDTKTFSLYDWPSPQTATVIAGELVLPNDSSDAIVVHGNEHICQIRSTSEAIPFSTSSPSPKIAAPTQVTRSPSDIVIDAQLSDDDNLSFQALHDDFHDVFQPVIGRYNDYGGKIRARVNLGNTKPPSRKLHAPNYCKNDQNLLQDKFDDLERQGVFVRPEDVDVVVEHVSPSFLVRKPSGDGYRLVTAFCQISEYCKTLPISMPTVDDTLRSIAAWRFLIKTDLRDSFYQVPLEKTSMKWCGTQTPFRGLRCYAVSAQGMPGSSETLDEMLNTILGTLIREGIVAKIADDLYVGSHSDVNELRENWCRVLFIMRQNGLKLKSAKTHIAPTSCQILGWDWNNGTIAASPHKISPLASCEPPATTTAMRSFIGAYKVLNRVLKGCSGYLSDLETAIAGRQKSDKVVWNDALLNSFHRAQDALKSATNVVIPKPSDQLVITHDGSKVGIGSILFVNRGSSLRLAGFFSAKLKSHQSRWLPCELEALSIASSIQHFSPYIRESSQVTQILTDSKPCVQAFAKMQRGEFSTSSRVATFLSYLSQHRVELHHISGKMNLPSDFHSRNPPSCTSSSCQICKFINDSDEATVRAVTVDDILSGHVEVPFTNRIAWKTLQLECPDLRRVHAHLSKGTQPSPKQSNQTAVKRYLNEVIISRDGLLVTVHSEPYLPRRELIVVPRHIIPGLLTSLHLQLNHPSTYQLQKVFAKNYYAQGLQKHLSAVFDACHTCQSLRTIPKEFHEQSTVDKPESPCRSFSADVIKRHNQKIFVIRDTFSSFTLASIVKDESSESLKQGLFDCVSAMRPNPQTEITVRVDNAPGFKGLRDDNDLASFKITLDFGRVKNKNKNPVIDKGIRELISEILRFAPDGGKVPPLLLAASCNMLNSRIRNRGLSAWEILFKRDQFSNCPLNIPDNLLSDIQHNSRKDSHFPSAKSKSGGGPSASVCDVACGSLVYVKNDGDKHNPRERYLVTDVLEDRCIVQKLTNTLRNVKYNLKLTEIFPVSSAVVVSDDWSRGLETEEEELDYIHNDHSVKVSASNDASFSEAHSDRVDGGPSDRVVANTVDVGTDGGSDSRIVVEAVPSAEALPIPRDENGFSVQEFCPTSEDVVPEIDTHLDIVNVATLVRHPKIVAAESCPTVKPTVVETSTSCRPRRNKRAPKRFDGYELY